MHERAYTLAGVIALGMALTASACGPHSPTTAPSATSSASAHQAQETPARPAREDGAIPPLAPGAPAPGTVLRDQAAAEQARAHGAGIYVASTGALIALDPGATLPPAVTDDLTQALTPLRTPPATDQDAATQAGILAGALDALAGAGKQPVLIVPAHDRTGAGTTTTSAVIVTEAPAFAGLTDLELRHPVAAAARAQVAATIGSHPDPTYAVVDLTD